MGLYATIDEIKAQAEASDASADAVWTALAKGTSRLFDRQTEVADDFFAVTDDSAREETIYGDGTKYARLPLPIIPDSLVSVTIDAEAVDAEDYYQSGIYLVFTYEITKRAVIVVNAKWGFPGAEIAADIKQAVIEQAIFMWRRKDLNFAEIAGVSSGVLLQEFSPSFEAITRKYRDKYGDIAYFA